MAGSDEVSIVTRHTFGTAARERMLAIELVVVPYGPEVWKISNHTRLLETAVGDGMHCLLAGTYVAKHVLVVEHRNGGLRVQ